METSIPGIYAAGDVCQADWGSHSQHWFQMRLWTQVWFTIDSILKLKWNIIFLVKFSVPRVTST